MKQKSLLILAAIAAVAPATLSAEAISVYLKASSAWATTKLYKWETVNGKDVTIGSAWSGDVLTESVTIDDEKYWVYTFDEKHTKVNYIFNDGGSNQTSDIKEVTETKFYSLNSKTGKTISVTDLGNPYVLDNPTISSDNNIVTITPSKDGGDIYYTLDGSEPDKTSTVYTEPFELKKDATVRARQMKTDSKSDIVDFNFVWQYYTNVALAPSILYVTENETAEICLSDFAFLPIEGGDKATNQPDNLYIQGNLKDHQWETSYELAAKRYGDCFVFENVEMCPEKEDNLDRSVYFSFSAKTGKDWNAVNGGNRYGAASENTQISCDNEIAYTQYTANQNASACKSWKATEGVYNIIVNFTTKKVILTQKEMPSWAAMTLTSVEADGMSCEGKNLFKCSTDGISDKTLVGIKDGETFINAGSAEVAQTYICHDGKLEVCPPVTIGLFDAENNVHTGTSYLMASAGTTAATYTVDDFTVEFDGNRADLDITAEDNALVAINWTATNGQGITFHGDCSVINHPEGATDVKVFALKPNGWNDLRYEIVSDLDSEHNASGIFENKEGNYFVITVPTHLVHSTIVFSSSTDAPAEEEVASLSDDNDNQSISLKLSGKTMYLARDGQYWAQTPPATSGIEAIASESETAPVYYNLQGIQVANPVSGGLYIRCSGSKTDKVILK